MIGNKGKDIQRSHLSEEQLQRQEELREKSVKYDRKNFPACNQASFCWQKYNEYLHCMLKTERNEEKCSMPKLHYQQVCPISWVEKWEEQREAGVFLGVPLDPLAPELTKHH